MTQRKPHGQQSGASFVEAAIILPLLLLIVFASIFLFLLATRNFALQMVANDISRSVSLALQGDPRIAETTCMDRCINAGRQTTALSFIATATIESNKRECWKGCASTQYLLPQLKNTDIEIAPTVVGQAWDAAPGLSTGTSLSAGDLFRVTVTCPFAGILNEGRVPFLGLMSGNLVGTSVGVVEKP